MHCRPLRNPYRVSIAWFLCLWFSLVYNVLYMCISQLRVQSSVVGTRTVICVNGYYRCLFLVSYILYAEYVNSAWDTGTLPSHILKSNNTRIESFPSSHLHISLLDFMSKLYFPFSLPLPTSSSSSTSYSLSSPSSTYLMLIRTSSFCSFSTTSHTMPCTRWIATPLDIHRSPM